MTFELTDNLLDEILSALENQEQMFMVDAKDGDLVPAEDAAVEDGEQYYELPEWNSEAGFKLREDFVNNLHAPLAREALLDVLHSGRGVFRNFKDVLKNYPEVDKLWHSWKNRKMRSYIGGWYNDLRELWGLEKLDQTPEETGNLIHDDFTFQEYDSVRDSELILRYLEDIRAVQGENDNWPQEIQNAVSELWRERFERGVNARQTGYICKTLSNEFAGCITVSSVSSQAEKTVVLTSFFVPETFRGLGIGSELFSMCLSDLQKRGKEWILIADTIIPDSIQPLLLRTGFEKTGSGFAAKLQ